MLEIRKTENYAQWIDNLRDLQARARVQVRIERLVAGNPGDVRAVGEGVSELRIDYGPGYRVYYKWYGEVLIVLLTGGDKDSQARDIGRAKRMAKEADDGIEDASV